MFDLRDLTLAAQQDDLERLLLKQTLQHFSVGAVLPDELRALCTEILRIRGERRRLCTAPRSDDAT